MICLLVGFLCPQALDVDPATGLLEGDEDEEGFEEEYPLEQLNIATADFMAKVCVLLRLLLFAVCFCCDCCVLYTCVVALLYCL